jgi:hypothetical protein
MRWRHNGRTHAGGDPAPTDSNATTEANPISEINANTKAMTIGAPENKGLERTRRVGVPASRAVVGVPPCRSTQCSAGGSAAFLRHRGGSSGPCAGWVYGLA